MVLDYTFDRQLALEREDSRRAGWKDGRAAGMKAGMEAGMEAGRAAGMEAGRAAGMEAGRAAGMEAGRAAGRLEGKAEGRAEGELRKLVVQIYKKMQRQKSVAQIAEELEESEEDIHLIYETLLNDFQNFDADRICSELLEKNNGRGQD